MKIWYVGYDGGDGSCGMEFFLEEELYDAEIEEYEALMESDDWDGERGMLCDGVFDTDRPEPPNDWSVFNSGAEVASGLSYAEAWDYLTPERLARGWSVVCVVNKDNAPPWVPTEP